MSLFFLVFFWKGLEAEMGGFAVFFEGGFEKSACLMWCFAGEFVVNCVVNVDRKRHVAWSLKTCHFLRFIFMFDVEKSSRTILGTVHQSTERVSFFCAGPGFDVVIVGDGFDRERKDVVMHEWMMGVGFIAILMTPCLIAMRPGADDERDDQETAGLPSARRLKLL
jgi:hypothetical protein